MDINKAIRSAINHHQAGNLRQAESLYKKISKRQLNNADILHMLGVINSQLENFDCAIDNVV
jgi:protein O-GlcNAc transferase